MTSPTMTRHHVTNGDAELYVEQHGSGPDVLLIAGLTDPAEVWHAQIEGLSERFRLTTYDNRGVGRTSAPIESFSLEAFASDAAAIIEHLELGRPHVMGFSGGGVIAQHLTLSRPELVRSLVLNGTFCEVDELLDRRFGWFLTVAAASESPEAFMRSFLALIYTRAAHADGRVDRWIEEALAFPHPMSDEAFVATLEAFRVHDVRERLGEIAVPTLVIGGDEDAIIPPSYVRDIAEGIPGAELVMLEGHAHQPFHEIPDEYNALMTGFWDRVKD